MTESDQIRAQRLSAKVSQYKLDPAPRIDASSNSISGESLKLANALHFEIGRKLEGVTGLGTVLSLVAQRQDMSRLQASLVFCLTLFFFLSTFFGILQDLRDHGFFRRLPKDADRTETTEGARKAQLSFAALGGIVVVLLSAAALFRSLTPGDEYFCKVRPISSETSDEFAIQAPLGKVRLLRIIRCN